VRLAYLTGPGGLTSRIELPTVVDPHLSPSPRQDRRASQRPGRDPGQNGWVVHTRDVRAAAEVAVARGGRLRCAPFELDNAPYGPTLVAGVETPNSIAVDLVGPLTHGTGP
jgi:hypothetical protein